MRVSILTLISLCLVGCGQPAVRIAPAGPALPTAWIGASNIPDSGTLAPSVREPIDRLSTSTVTRLIPSSFPPAADTDSIQYQVMVPWQLWERLGDRFGSDEEVYTFAIEAPEQANLWERLRAGLALPGRHRPEARETAHDYAEYQEFMDQVVERARPYLYYVVDEIAKRNFPMEIALVPIIESSYLASANSHKGAAGIWQFIPSTGKNYGLKQTFWYDGRRDIAASTIAALDYLQKLNIDFDGDWLLTLAAYNCGEGTVLRAMKKNREANKPTDFWSLDLPRETKNYIPRLLGVSAIVANPDDFSIVLNSIPDAPYLASVDLDSQINLQIAADIADISHLEITQLNPGFKRGSTDPQGPHQLLLPVDKVAGFTAKLALLNLDQRMPDKAQLPDRKKSKSPAKKKPAATLFPEITPNNYQIQQGDSLSRIAQRFKVTIAQLRAWNTDILTGKYLKPGHTLRISPDNSALPEASAHPFR